MAASALYGICARLIENGEPGQLLACASVTDLADLPAHMQELSERYADRDDVVLDLDTTLTAALVH